MGTSAPHKPQPDHPQPKGPGQGGQDEIPQEIRAIPDERTRNWALTAYNRAKTAEDKAAAEAERARTLEGERDAARREAEYRAQLVADLTRATTTRARDDSQVDPSMLEPHRGGTPPRRELPRLDFDPFAPDAAEKIQQYVIAIQNAAAMEFADWYLKDRNQMWDGVVKHQAAQGAMALEGALLIRDDPDLQPKDLMALYADAPQHGYSVRRAYEARFADKLVQKTREQIRGEVRQEVERERGTLPPPPPTDAPPMLVGGRGPVPRRTGQAPVPRSYGDATRQAWESARGKLLEPR